MWRAVHLSRFGRAGRLADRRSRSVEHHRNVAPHSGLELKAVKLSQVEKMSDFLVHNLGFFFVPAGVGLMGCLDLLGKELLPIVGAMVVSTAVILVVTGHVHQLVRRHMRLKNIFRKRRVASTDEKC